MIMKCIKGALLSGLIVFLALLMSEKLSPMWAGLFITIPVALTSVIFLNDEGKIPQYAMTVAWTTLFSAMVTFIFYYMYVNYSWNKYMCLTLSLGVWISLGLCRILFFN